MTNEPYNPFEDGDSDTKPVCLKLLLRAYDSFLQCIVTVVSVHNSLQ